MQVVGAIIRNERDEYLLQLRDGNARIFKNKWTLFGGRVEDGEELQEALLRELDEELSLPLTAIKSLKQIQTNQDDNGTEQHIYEVRTDVELEELILGEGAGMMYVGRDTLFDREFAFNIEEVMKRYLAELK